MSDSELAFSTHAILYGGCAAVYVLLSALIFAQSRLSRTANFLAMATLSTAFWAAAAATGGEPPLGGVTGGLDLLQSIVWFAFLLHLYRRSVPGDSRNRGLFLWMGGGAVLISVAAVLVGRAPADGTASLMSTGIAVRLALAACKLLVIENLYRNTPSDARWHISLPCVALGGLFIYDIALCGDAALFRRVSPLLYEGRAIATAIVAPLLAIGAARNRRWAVDIHVSHAAVFHSATMVVSGVFLLGLAAVGELFRRVGAGWGAVAEIALIFGGVMAVAVLVTSGSARSFFRGILVEHFFNHRFDYRAEWMRCIGTLSGPDTYVPLHTRAIRAVAQVVDSPGGALLLRDSVDQAFQWAGSWNMPASPAPVPPDHPLVGLLRNGTWVVVVDPDLAKLAPLDAFGDIWLAVPLPHGGRLHAFVLTASPRAPFALDREAFDLLRVIGQQVGGTIAEQRATEQVLQTRQLHEYGKRFAFVAHDIKNVSSQLSMLLSNAELHMQNEAFQRDMLTTVRASVQRIGTMIRRLQSPESDIVRSLTAPTEAAETVAAQCRRVGGASLTLDLDGQNAFVAMDRNAFEAVLTHLVTNAIEAAGPGGAVELRVRHSQRRLIFDVIDNGPGMTPAFIRDELFRPFRTSKREGSGIGVFQARELLREAGGDLLIISHPSEGTTMRVLLPLIETVPTERAAVSA